MIKIYDIVKKGAINSGKYRTCISGPKLGNSYKTIYLEKQIENAIEETKKFIENYIPNHQHTFELFKEGFSEKILIEKYK